MKGGPQPHTTVEFGETQRLALAYSCRGDEEEVPHREVGANGLANQNAVTLNGLTIQGTVRETVKSLHTRGEAPRFYMHEALLRLDRQLEAA